MLMYCGITRPLDAGFWQSLVMDGVGPIDSSATPNLIFLTSRGNT